MFNFSLEIIKTNLTVCPFCRSAVTFSCFGNSDQPELSVRFNCKTELETENCMLLYCSSSFHFYVDQSTFQSDANDPTERNTAERIYRLIAEYQGETLADKLGNQVKLYLTFR